MSSPEELPELPAYGLDRAVRLADGIYLLVSPGSKGWTPRLGGSQTKAAHPGAAIRWADRLFEVAAADPQADGGMRYRLEPWDDRHAMRVVHSYDEASEAAREREHTERARSGDWRLLSMIFAPVLGHLPGAVQHRMETEFGAPARWMTVLSALPVFVVGFLGLFGQVLGFVGAGGYLGFEMPLAVAAYLTCESAVRIGSAWVGGEPMGSLVGVLLWEAVATVLGRRRGSVASWAVSGVPASRAIGSEERLRDRFHMLEPFLALLPEKDQRHLVARFQFDALRWGRVSVGVLFVVGGLNFVASILDLAGASAGVGDPARWIDLVWLVIGAGLCLEQFVRRAALARRDPRGSVLGALVMPLARPLLETPTGRA
jgi:hypothetical protein